jgi:hypothetical protein
MLAPSKGSPRQKDYVVVGGQKVYLNFIHAKRQNHSNFPIPHSLANPFVKESSLVGAVRSAPASTTAAKRSPSGSRRRAEDDAAAAEPPPVILELRNQIIEHELGRRGDDDDGADDCEFSIEEFTPPAAAAKKRKAAEAAAAASAIKRELEAVEMKRAVAEQDKRAGRETRREIEKEKMARQKVKGKEKAPESSEEDENENDEGGNEGEEETDIPISKRQRTTVEPARRQPDKTPRTRSAVRHNLCAVVSSFLTANFVCWAETTAISGGEQQQDFTHFPSRSAVTRQVAVHGAHLSVRRRINALGQTHDTSQEPTDLRLFLRRLCIVSPADRCSSNLEFDRAYVIDLNLYLLYHFSLYPLLARSHVVAVGRIRDHFVLPRHD